MTLKNRVKSVLRFPDRKRNIRYKGYTRPYRRNIYGKLYLYFMNMKTRQAAEQSAGCRFKDFILAPYHLGPKKRKRWGIYVEANELVAYHKRRKK